MTKIIAVTGATGSQGGGVVNIMKTTPGWSIRAVTRNPGSEAAKKLAAEGIEVVQASFDDEETLVAAFKVRIRLFLECCALVSNMPLSRMSMPSTP